MSTPRFLALFPERLRVFGDWHGNVQFALDQLEAGLRDGITVFVHVGDYGLWPFGIPRSQWTTKYGFIATMQSLLESHDAVLGFIDGNHEDFGELAKLPRTTEGLGQVSPNIFYIPRGTVWEWKGTRFAGMGGAISIDRDMRRPGFSWFPEEAITAADVARTKAAGSVDVLFTHEAPALPVPKYAFSPSIDADCARSVAAVHEVVAALHPQLVIHGHYHLAYRSTDEFPGTEIIGLDCDQGLGRDNYVDLVPGTSYILSGMKDLMSRGGGTVDPGLAARLDAYVVGLDPGSARLVSSALEYATALHSGQVRTGFDGVKTPYINHPVSVAWRLIEWGVDDPQVVAAALLHDVVEDCSDLIESHLIDVGTATQWVQLQFGSRVAGTVVEVTNTNGQKYVDKIKRLVERGSTDALLVKASDLADNAGTIPLSGGGSRAAQLAAKYGPVLPMVVEELRRLGYRTAADELSAASRRLGDR